MNIFDKDFLIVPINKSSHWYLAIICYPYLDEPIYDIHDDTVSSKNSFRHDFDDEEDSRSTMISDSAIRDKARESSTSTAATEVVDSADEAEDDEEEEELHSAKSKIKPCSKMPVILIFDSLPFSNKSKVIATLKE